MTDLENIHYHIDRCVLSSAEIATLITRYTDKFKHDQKVDVQILAELARVDPFFINFNLDAFREALNSYKVPLTK